MTARALSPELLDVFAAHLARVLPQPDEMGLARELRRVQQRFGTFGSPALNQSRVEAALHQALRDPAQLRPSQRFMLAFTLTESSSKLRGQCILEHEKLFASLLDRWERDAKEQRLKLSHWKGLFHSYMQASVGPARDRLRTFLAQTLESVVQVRKYRPSWLSGFERHRQLLGKKPCAPYLEELVRGESGHLRDLTEEAGVSIADTSWFWQELKQEAIAHIGDLEGSHLLRSMQRLIGLPELIKGSTDEILVALLNRYHACTDRSLNKQLMDFALHQWGSPQLDSNLNWILCSRAARQMVCGWIAVQDLQEFYHLCRRNQEVDERRLRFWLQFIGQMSYTQILLGRGMLQDPTVDVRQFVQKRRAQKRLGELAGGDRWNNAIVMRIGDWTFVEFIQIGTACRAFRTEETGFKIGAKSYALDMLRRTGKGWGHWGEWEDKFITHLAELGVQPDRSDRVTLQRTPPLATETQRQRASTDSIIQELRMLRLEYVDHRPKNGNLWVYTPRSMSEYVQGSLEDLGFRYHPEKMAWYL